jgi:hypothetical protein
MYSSSIFKIFCIYFSKRHASCKIYRLFSGHLIRNRAVKLLFVTENVIKVVLYKTVNCPGIVILIIPPHMHVHISPLQTTGPVGMMTIGFEGSQGATVAGMHGIGVNTPRAAAVADATVGLVIVEHIPNVMIFTIGIISAIETTGNPHAKTGFFGITEREDGAVPNEHLHNAPQTAIGIILQNL